jgi:2-polyprenyl-3-methyl-5-hydroxy-6-metoxy-1,4-benzoquinol methylase
MNTNSWDNLADVFGSSDDLDDIPAEAADNILIAWPIIVDFITDYGGSPKNKNALDYGCGGGSFAAKLHTLGYTAKGIDTSVAMIAKARKHYSQYAAFLTGNEFKATQEGPYSLITSLMTFEFISNIEQVLPILLSALEPGGVFVFATHNPEYVYESAKSENSPYTDFDAEQHSTQGTLSFGDTKVPLFIRDAKQYKAMLEPLGFVPLLEEYPPFTPQFLTKYPTEGPTDYSEYLILGFRKQA